MIETAAPFVMLYEFVLYELVLQEFVSYKLASSGAGGRGLVDRVNGSIES